MSNVDDLSNFKKGGKGGSPENQVKALMEFAITTCDFRCDSSSGQEFACYQVKGVFQIWPIKSTNFREYLSSYWFDKHGRIPSRQVFDEVIDTLKLVAKRDGRETSIARRVCQNSRGGRWIDLNNSRGEVVFVSFTGMEIQTIDRCPFIFERTRSMGTLPMPDFNGTKKDFFTYLDLLNVRRDNEDGLMLIAWMIDLYISNDPHPMVFLRAGEGSGKTTTAKLLLEFLDPRSGDGSSGVNGVQAFPKKEQDLMVLLKSAHVHAFDNLQGISGAMSDALCRIVTGAEFSVRKLYSDDEIVSFKGRWPIILTGIADVVLKQDLASRTIRLDLPILKPEKRTTEGAIWEKFKKIRRSAFGYFLELITEVLSVLPDIPQEGLPRMAEFARTGIALERVFKMEPGTFLKAFESCQRGLTLSLLERPLVNVLWHYLVRAEGEWKGTISKLLDELNHVASATDLRSPDWPKTPRELSSDLKNLQQALSEQGIIVDFQGHKRNGTVVSLSIPKVKEDFL